MPGAWEIQHVPAVAIGIIHAHATTVEWGISLARMERMGAPIHESVGMPYDHARNSCVQRALAGS